MCDLKTTKTDVVVFLQHRLWPGLERMRWVLKQNGGGFGLVGLVHNALIWQQVF